MENIVDERPTDDLHGRCLYTISYVDKKDIKEKTVLDIGCGYGWFELFAINTGVKKIVATEIKEENLITAKKYLKNKNISFKVNSSVILPFAKETFDTVSIWEVIEHVPVGSQLKLISEINRVLKKGGILYLSTQNSNFFANIFDFAWWFGHRHYKLSCLKKMIENFGFKMLNFEIKGNFWEIFSIIDLYFSKWLLGRKPLFKDFSSKRNDRDFFEKKGMAIIFCKFKKA